VSPDQPSRRFRRDGVSLPGQVVDDTERRDEDDRLQVVLNPEQVDALLR
jgi:hypothetical protein